ncbi:MAG: T9SS type A sorting domain-containing protein, partial [Calditrichaceae bacterium]
LTRPLDFNKKAVVAYSKNDSVIIVLSNPNNTVIFDAGYLVESARVITGANPVGVQSGSGHMQFLNVPQNAVIRIYNILGQRIKTLHNGSADQILWNYNDQSGRQIATGIYIFSVEAAAFNFTGKLTILK